MPRGAGPSPLRLSNGKGKSKTPSLCWPPGRLRLKAQPRPGFTPDGRSGGEFSWLIASVKPSHRGVGVHPGCARRSNKCRARTCVLIAAATMAAGVQSTHTIPRQLFVVRGICCSICFLLLRFALTTRGVLRAVVVVRVGPPNAIRAGILRFGDFTFRLQCSFSYPQ